MVEELADLKEEEEGKTAEGELLADLKKQKQVVVQQKEMVASELTRLM